MHFAIPGPAMAGWSVGRWVGLRSASCGFGGIVCRSEKSKKAMPLRRYLGLRGRVYGVVGREGADVGFLEAHKSLNVL